MSLQRVSRWRLSRGLLGLFVGLVLLAAAGFWLWGQQRQLAAVTQDLQSARPGFTVWRWTLYLAVIGGWPSWLAYLRQRSVLDEAISQRLLAARWRLAGWLLLLELVLAQNLVGCFVAQLAS